MTKLRPEKEPNTNSSQEMLVLDVDAGLDMAISAALDGYANDQPVWMEAYTQFYETLNKGCSSFEALTGALFVARDGAESSDAEAQGRFENALAKSETYDQAIANTGARIDTIFDALAKKGEGLSPVSDPNIEKRSHQLLPYEGTLWVEQKIDAEDGKKEYKIVDARTVHSNHQVYRYSWDESDRRVTQHRSGPPEGDTTTLEQGEAQLKLSDINRLLEIEIHELSQAESDRKPRSSRRLALVAAKLIPKL